MKVTILMALFTIASLSSLIAPTPVYAQACKDEEDMVKEVNKSLDDFIGTVKKESLSDFQKAYHQKSSMSKLTFCLGAIDGLLGCLDKAAQDTTTPKEEVDAAKGKRETYTKVKDRISQDLKTLKDTSDSKQAKALIEKINL